MFLAYMKIFCLGYIDNMMIYNHLRAPLFQHRKPIT